MSMIQTHPKEASLPKDLEMGVPNLHLWDQLDDVTFWIKDTNGCFVWVNVTLAKQTQMSRDEIIGNKDTDCFPGELADIYMRDDAKIVSGGSPIKNKPELVMTPEGGVEWRQTSKFPIRNSIGEIIGTTGISRKMDADVPLPPEYAGLAKILTYANRHLSKGIKVQELAKAMHFSISTLERYVHQHLGITPNELLRKLKIDRACQLLSNSTLNIGEIAMECGYDSESSFSRAFRRTIGRSPGKYRKDQCS